MSPISVVGGDERLLCHPVKKSTDYPRTMYPVEKYDKANIK